MSLGVSEREHLAGVPVEDGAVGLGVGCDDGVNESADVTRYVAGCGLMCAWWLCSWDATSI